MAILDSGNRRKFKTGAERDIDDNKGRCDLMPLDIVGTLLDDTMFFLVERFKEENDQIYLYEALRCFAERSNTDQYTMILDVAKHFADGAKKYGEYNWQKGIPVKSYLDSAVRHYLKWLREDNDEPHDKAFVWNLLCCLWTIKHHPAMNDFALKKEGEK